MNAPRRYCLVFRDTKKTAGWQSFLIGLDKLDDLDSLDDLEQLDGLDRLED